MRDATDGILYVGKAKNLRQRLASYRVANPERLRRRHLRLLRAVARIELEPCADEASALARESELLRSLRPRFNRAGTWTGPRRFIGWRVAEEGLQLSVFQAPQAGVGDYVTSPTVAPISVLTLRLSGHSRDDPVSTLHAPHFTLHGPLGAHAFPLRAALARLLWCAIHLEDGFESMPQGWLRSRRCETMTIPRPRAGAGILGEAADRLGSLFSGGAEAFAEWIRQRTLSQTHPFETAVREADLDTVTKFFPLTSTAPLTLLPGSASRASFASEKE